MKKKRYVIKIGSQMIVSGGPLLLRSLMLQVKVLKEEHDIDIIWITSGAIASAIQRVKKIRIHKNKTLTEKQALSAIGQPYIMEQYNLALNSCGLLGAQILLTADDLNSGKRKKNFINSISELLKWNVVPVLNENDAVSTDEIKFGDNDMLSARVAIALNADRLIILTDVDGFYDKDPTKYSNAKKISFIKNINEKIISLAGGKSSSGRGTGGMRSKLLAAKFAQKKKIPTNLVKADIPNSLIRIFKEEYIGTQIGGER